MLDYWTGVGNMEVVMIRNVTLIGGLGLFISLCAPTGAIAAIADCSEGEREVRPVSREQPYYPHSARMFCLSGEVKAEFTIDTQGRTTDIRIVESEPEAVFDRAAIEAIEQWRFTPACREGAPADREAIQTIEFRLPDESERDCADTVGQLDDDTARLIGEIGSRYALLAQYWETGEDWAQVESGARAPFGEFEGDLARVADFHEHALEMIVEAAREEPLAGRFNETLMALQAPALAEDPDLKTARRMVDQYQRAVDDEVEASRQQHRELASAYGRLKANTRLEPETLRLLIHPFLGDPGAPFDEFIEPRLAVIEDLRAILEFMELNRDEWRIADNRLQFQHQADERDWNTLWDDLIERREQFVERDRRFMQSFRDYAD